MDIYCTLLELFSDQPWNYFQSESGQSDLSLAKVTVCIIKSTDLGKWPNWDNIVSSELKMSILEACFLRQDTEQDMVNLV